MVRRFCRSAPRMARRLSNALVLVHVAFAFAAALTILPPASHAVCTGTPNCGQCRVAFCDGDGYICNPKTDGTVCNDGNLCTTGDHCSAGTCVGTPVTCSPLDQ